MFIIPGCSVWNKGVYCGVGDCIFVQSLIIGHTFVFESVSPQNLPRNIRRANLKMFMFGNISNIRIYKVYFSEKLSYFPQEL